MKNNKLKQFYILWSTQSLSQLGSSITGFALTLWLYEKTGSALETSLLAICTYAPYVIMSILAGALTDKWDKKKTMLTCDALAAFTTFMVFVLIKTNLLQPWHLYVLNAFSGLMNTVQQPASEVASTLIIPKDCYQKTSGLMSFSRSLISILNPLIATALYSFAGMNLIVVVDLCTFAVAFVALLLFIKLPEMEANKTESVIKLAKEGLGFLKATPMVFTLIIFMAGVNFVASAFDATLPAFVIPNPKGGAGVLGIVTSTAGVAMLIGSFVVSILPKPKNRVRVVFGTMLFSLGTENFLLAFCREPWVWVAGQILGWLVVPIMSANLDVILRNTIPVDLQGRVYACRNTFQFFTIPIGLFFGGFMVDNICEPFMEKFTDGSFMNVLFGYGKGSGAALMMFILGILGIAVCLITGARLKNYSYTD